MKIKIKVTKEILERSKMCGIESNFIVDSCAIALGVRDIFPNAHVVRYIDPFGNDDPLAYKIDLPEMALKFLDEFDTCDPEQRIAMQPISFDIEVPDSVIERIGISQVYKILSESKTLEYVGG